MRSLLKKTSSIIFLTVGIIGTGHAASVFPMQAEGVGDWILSGLLTDENGQDFGYVLSISQRKDRVHVLTELIDVQTNSLWVQSEVEGPLEQPSDMHWCVKEVCWAWQSITDRWWFGVKLADKRGLHLKIDMLGADAWHKERLKPEMYYSIRQTGTVNGHVHSLESDKDSFVIGQRAVIRVMEGDSSASLTMQDVLCQLDNGQTFYAWHTQETGVAQSAFAQWYGAHGQSAPMSQFVQATADPQGWKIALSIPKISLLFQEAQANAANALLIGALSGAHAGFCAVRNS
ncbi:MAG: hypothetical protein Q8R79_06285 [Legionellaceae bacterium]|nr:hypothetical protein [Legionellaceae bacterium]